MYIIILTLGIKFNTKGGGLSLDYTDIDPECQLYGGKRWMRKIYWYEDDDDIEDFLDECDDTLEDYA